MLQRRFAKMAAVLAAGFIVLAAAAPGSTFAQSLPSAQPAMYDALAGLEHTLNALQHARDSKGGHVPRAIRDVNAAIAEVRAAIAYGDAHQY